MILAVKALMSLATLVYAAAYAMRRRNNWLHRRLNLLGFGLTLAIAVVLAVGVRFLGASYRPAYWLVEALGREDRAWIVLQVHRGWASLTLVLLITQVVAGLRRAPLHRKLAPWVIAAWLISYVSGSFIFA